MSERFETDLFVIGGGSGGVRAARIAASYGAKVMMAEEYRLGGTCVIRGCVPKKLLVYASRFHDEFEDAAGFGWTVPETSFDWATLIANKDVEIDRLEGVYERNLTRVGVDIVRERAVVAGPHRVTLASGRTIHARHILVATGAAPSWPELPGRELAISSNEAFHLKEMPKRIAIAGGGYIAVEFAGIFAGLGAEVTLVYRGAEILRGFDADLSRGLTDAYEARGIRIVTDARFEALEKAGGAIEARLSTGERLTVDQVMFAIGRNPNTQGLGLETAGVELGRNGAVKVDQYSATNVPSIHAVGDVTDRVNLTPVAIREGHAYADTVFGGKNIAVDHANIPTAVFSTPELGTVGLTEARAKELLPVVDIYRAAFRPMKATMSRREERMILKLVVDGDTDRVVGAHMLGEGAGEMAQMLGILVRMGATKADFDATVAVHPSAAEEFVTMRERAARFVQTGETAKIA